MIELSDLYSEIIIIKKKTITLNFDRMMHLSYFIILFKEFTKYIINTQSVKDNSFNYLQPNLNHNRHEGAMIQE
jgi:hypothetical protein